MEKDTFRNLQNIKMGEESDELEPPVVNPYDRLELSGVFGRNEALGEHDLILPSKDSHEEMKIPHNRVYISPAQNQDLQVHNEAFKTFNDKSHNIPEVKKPGKYICNICNKTYKKKNNLDSHMRNHVLFKDFFRQVRSLLNARNAISYSEKKVI